MSNRISGFRIPSMAVLFLLCVFTMSRAQWVQTLSAEDPRTPKVFTLATIGSTVFAGFESGVFRTPDNGATWDHPLTGLSPFVPIFAFVKDGAVLFAATIGGVYRSTDNGESWTRSGMSGFYVVDLALKDDILFAVTCCNGVYKSFDHGSTWTSSGLEETVSVAAGVSGIYVGTTKGLYLSRDTGGVWEKISMDSALIDVQVNSITVVDSEIYVATKAGLYRSSDAGVKWIKTALIDNCLAPAITGSAVFAITAKGIVRSMDKGDSWEDVNTGLPWFAHCLTLSGGNLFAGIPGSGVWKRPLQEMGVTSALVSDNQGRSHNSSHKIPPRRFGVIGSRSIMEFASPFSEGADSKIHDAGGRSLPIR